MVISGENHRKKKKSSNNYHWLSSSSPGSSSPGSSSPLSSSPQHTSPNSKNHKIKKKKGRLKQNMSSTTGGGGMGGGTGSSPSKKHSPSHHTAAGTSTTPSQKFSHSHTGASSAASTPGGGIGSIFRENSSRSPSFSGTDFAYINEKPVDDVSIGLFYEPRTLTLLCLAIGALVYVAFNRCVNNNYSKSSSGGSGDGERVNLKNGCNLTKASSESSEGGLMTVVEWVMGTYCAVIRTLLIDTMSGLFLLYSRDESNIQDNLSAGFKCVVFFFMIISVLAFPNGPFTRPHPAVWRMVFGVSVLYLLALVFILFQNYDTVKSIFYWIDPELRNFSIDNEKEYGVNCSQITVERVWSHLDVFALAHFTGWMMKAVLLRHIGVLWTISVTWEITEVAFAHLLPNFVECWWDAIILDIFVCNGLGIWVGMKIVKLLEMREYKWNSIKTIHGTTGKLKRAVLQFTPESWTPVRWLDPCCTYMRFLAVCQLVIFWQIAELNTFFIKHIFETPPAHNINLCRLALLSMIVAPSLRQYYVYVTDARCKRVGTQCWVLGAITATEAIICCKFGRTLMGQAQAKNIVLWLLVQLALSMVCVTGCVIVYNVREKMKERRRASIAAENAMKKQKSS